MWEPRPLTTLWATSACYRDSFTFTAGDVTSLFRRTCACEHLFPKAKYSKWKMMSGSWDGYLTNFIEKESFLEDESGLAEQTFRYFLWNPSIQYHIQKNPPLDPILSQINPVYISHSFLNIHFNIFSHLHRNLLGDVQVYRLKCCMNSTVCKIN
jgi:hypothetical protein